MLRILQSYLSAQQSGVVTADNTESVDIDNLHNILRQTSNSNNKSNIKGSKIANSALQVFAVKHAIRRVLSKALHVSDNTNTLKAEANMLTCTLPLSLQLREALAAALSAFGGALPHEKMTVMTNQYNANLFICYNSSDHARSTGDSNTRKQSDNANTRNSLYMS